MDNDLHDQWSSSSLVYIVYSYEMCFISWTSNLQVFSGDFFTPQIRKSTF